MRSVMTHQFSQVPRADIPRSSFNRTHGYKTTFDCGYLIPVFVDLAVPGDTFNLRMSAFGRLSTPIVPIMDNLFLDSFFFAVPIRLIWDNWQKFNGEQTDPGDSTDFLTPQMVSPAMDGYEYGSLSDYFGIPTGVPGLTHNSFWHRAHNLIYNEWFRDQNMQDSVVVDKDDGPDDPADYPLLRRGKRHDYFTSCLPWPQKGPAVPLPLGTEAPITSRAMDPANSAYDGSVYLYSDVSTGIPGTLRDAAGPGALLDTQINLEASDTAGLHQLKWQQPDQFPDPQTDVSRGYNYADLSSATASTINALRQAFQLQKLYERDARGGTRYTEIIRSHFGVVSPDARLQRPEYLGGGSSPLNIHPIPQTSGTVLMDPDQPTPQGNLAAMGTLSASGHGFTKSFTEHCVLIGLVAVRADLNYQQGLNRMFSYRSRFEFYWPALSHIGEQAVLNKEIFAQGPAGDVNPLGGDNDVFGYQERYAEMRYKPSNITGKFRSSDPQSLDIWHLAQDFSDVPQLNDQFIVDNPPVDRIVAVDTEPQILFDAFFDLKCARPMPTYSVPGLIDHF